MQADVKDPAWHEIGTMVVNQEACLRQAKRNQARIAGLSWWDKVTLIVLELQASYRMVMVKKRSA